MENLERPMRPGEGGEDSGAGARVDSWIEAGRRMDERIDAMDFLRSKSYDELKRMGLGEVTGRMLAGEPGDLNEEIVNKVMELRSGAQGEPMNAEEEAAFEAELQRQKRMKKIGAAVLGVIAAVGVAASTWGIMKYGLNKDVKKVAGPNEREGIEWQAPEAGKAEFEMFEGTDYRNLFLNAEGDDYNDAKKDAGETQDWEWQYDISPRALDEFKAAEDTVGARAEVWRQMAREPEFLGIIANRASAESKEMMGLGGLNSVKEIEDVLGNGSDVLNRAEQAMMYRMEGAIGEFTKVSGDYTTYYMRGVAGKALENDPGSIEAARTATQHYEDVEVFVIHFEDGTNAILDMDCLNLMVPVEPGTPEAEVEPGVPILEETPVVLAGVAPTEAGGDDGGRDYEYDYEDEEDEEDKEKDKDKDKDKEDEPDVLEGKDDSLTNQDVKDNNKPLDQDRELTDMPAEEDYSEPKLGGEEVVAGEGGGPGTAVSPGTGESMMEGDNVETPELGNQENPPEFSEDTNEDDIADAEVVSEGDGLESPAEASDESAGDERETDTGGASDEELASRFEDRFT